MRVADGCSGYFGFGVCELISGDSFVPWYPQEGCRTQSSVVGQHSIALNIAIHSRCRL